MAKRGEKIKQDLMNLDIVNANRATVERYLTEFAGRTNITIKNLERLESKEDMRSPSLDYIQNESKTSKSGQGYFKSGIEMSKEGATLQSMKIELSRLRYFLGLKTSSVTGTRDYYKDRRNELKEAGFTKSEISKISNTEVKSIFSAFRYSAEMIGDWDSTNTFKAIKIIYKNNPDKFKTKFADLSDDEKARLLKIKTNGKEKSVNDIVNDLYVEQMDKEIEEDKKRFGDFTYFKKSNF